MRGSIEQQLCKMCWFCFSAAALKMWFEIWNEITFSSLNPSESLRPSRFFFSPSIRSRRCVDFVLQWARLFVEVRRIFLGRKIVKETREVSSWNMFRTYSSLTRKIVGKPSTIHILLTHTLKAAPTPMAESTFLVSKASKSREVVLYTFSNTGLMCCELFQSQSIHRRDGIVISDAHEKK